MTQTDMQGSAPLLRAELLWEEDRVEEETLVRSRGPMLPPEKLGEVTDWKEVSDASRRVRWEHDEEERGATE